MKALILLAALVTAAPAPSAEPLAHTIDARINAVLNAGGMTPAPQADDAEFLRRISLDLIGLIPNSAEARAFLDDANPNKRAELIDRLLADPRHAKNFARVWRALLLPEADTDRQVQYFQPGFDAWLRQSRERRLGMDAIVRELLTVPIVEKGQPPQVVLRDLSAPNPIAYFAAKEIDAAKIAAGVTRTFLGLRIECAECHDHPFDHWTRDQFWNQAAFFASLERRGKGAFSPLFEDRAKTSIAVMGTDRVVKTEFLTGGEPGREQVIARTALAEWITSRENPYFAKAMVNRVWRQLMGVGLVDPVDDFQETNAPSHPELLDELAVAFRDSGFNLDLLYRAICLSDAYQRTSRLTDPSQSDPRQYARMNLKAMSGEQFYAALMRAGGREIVEITAGREPDRDRRAILELFVGFDDGGDPQSSVRQTLALMNGRIVSDMVRMDDDSSKSLVAGEPSRIVEELYLATLTRRASESERATCLTHLADGPEEERPARAGDLLWALINSAEFQWNH